MQMFDPAYLVEYLEKKGWSVSTDQPLQNYWDCALERKGSIYHVQVPTYPYSKKTFFYGKVRGIEVDKATGDVLTAPHFEWKRDAADWRTYYDLRLWLEMLLA